MAARKKATRKKVARKPRRKVTRKAAPKKARAARAPDGPAFPEVEALVELMHRHQLYELDYKSAADGSREIRIARGMTGGVMPATAMPAMTGPAMTGPAGSPAAAAEGASMPAPGEDLHAFKSPMVGTFYRAPNPEASAFVSVGDRVDEDSTVCIIEAMKVLNEIAPDVAGEVVSIEVENGEAVEFGQTLFLIRPN